MNILTERELELVLAGLNILEHSLGEEVTELIEKLKESDL